MPPEFKKGMPARHVLCVGDRQSAHSHSACVSALLYGRCSNAARCAHADAHQHSNQNGTDDQYLLRKRAQNNRRRPLPHDCGIDPYDLLGRLRFMAFRNAAWLDVRRGNDRDVSGRMHARVVYGCPLAHRKMAENGADSRGPIIPAARSGVFDIRAASCPRPV